MLHTLKINTSELEVGMFVSGLDRPWLETPFIMQGFCVGSAEEIERLRNYCSYVFVDFAKSRNKDHPLLKRIRAVSTAVPIADIFPGRPLKPYPTTSEWKEESAQAWLVLDSLVDDVNAIFEHVSDGGALNVIRLKKSVEPVVESMSRNPDACIWLARLKQHDQYAYQHSLSASIWAVALGRQLGLPRHDLRSLAIGCMLMDVGKLRVDPDLLRAPRQLTEEESDRMREHVAHGVNIARESGMINQDVLDIVAHHHERFDGSGYPQGLVGDRIPPMARIAAIVDTYDAVTSNRSHAKAISPSDAIKLLYQSRNIEFQAELVEVFIQAVGIYPAGTIVELTSGEVGVVVSEYRTRRLKPKILMLLDKRKYRLREPRLIDLSEVQGDPDAPPLGIARSLEPGAYDIDLSQAEI
ncbi:MAG: HD-GYP domain-containing protein [Pseudomonadales bacterium]|nr:HD-GYP domain-containing protein [Halioglobus sp.]MCP5129043.1 HD-GYP domain-containing protein [Pseudomonadales bacterium]